MDLQTIKDLITILGFVILLWNQNRNRSKDVEEKTSNWIKVNIKLDQVCQSQTDIKDGLRALEHDSNNNKLRLSVLEEQIKVANHRIDDLENANK